MIRLYPEALADFDFLTATISYARINVQFLGVLLDHIRRHSIMLVAVYSDVFTSVGADSYALMPT